MSLTNIPEAIPLLIDHEIKDLTALKSYAGFSDFLDEVLEKKLLARRIKDIERIRSFERKPQDLERQKSLIPINVFCKKNSIKSEHGNSEYLCWSYGHNLYERENSCSISETKKQFEALQNAANALLGALNRMSPGALSFFQRHEIPEIHDLLEVVGDIEPPWIPDRKNRRDPLISERIVALENLARNGVKNIENIGGRRNFWDLTHKGSPLLKLMGAVAVFLDDKQKYMIPLARLVHEVVTVEPPPPGEWGKDEAARARIWWKIVGPWIYQDFESWPPEVEEMWEMGPGAIPSPMQARQRRKGITNQK